MGNGNSSTNKKARKIDAAASCNQPKKQHQQQEKVSSNLVVAASNDKENEKNYGGVLMPRSTKNQNNNIVVPQQQQYTKPTTSISNEQDPLLIQNVVVDCPKTTAVAIASAQIINESAFQIKKATAVSGGGSCYKCFPNLTFRTMGLIGGIAMVISNLAGVIDRFMSFKFPSAISAFYGIFFGILIILIEMPNRYGFEGGKWNASIRWYCKFLEYSWGRGLLYFYVGSIQVMNFNALDWTVGGYMVFVGIITLISAFTTVKDLRKFRLSIINENDLKEKWFKYDRDGNGALDAKELTLFVKESGVDMTRNEIASTFLALDKNFDDKISYEEFYFWWMGEQEMEGKRASKTIAV